MRLYRFDLTWFSLDQVRDVSVATDIATGSAVPLLGPRIGWTDAYLGPLYFYLLAIPFAFGRDPVAAVLFVTASQVVALLLLYRFAREFFGATVALYAVALCGVFPLMVFSSRLVWHAGLLPPFVILYMHALFRLVVAERSRAVVGIFAALGVLTQLHLASFTLGIVALAAVAVYRPRLRVADVALGAAVFVLLYAPYLAHELRHGFENLRALVSIPRPEPGGNPLRSLAHALESVLTLFAPALRAFIVESEWPPVLLAAVRAANSAEAVLFAGGIAVSFARLFGVGGAGAGDRGELRRGAALLLLWVSVPAVVLGTRPTPIWWYYLDPIYPAPFILAGIAAVAIPQLVVRNRAVSKGAARSRGCLIAGIVACQAVFLVGFQRITSEHGELIVDVPRLAINGVGSPIETLTALPLGYRREIVRSLERDFGVSPSAFADRVHGAVLGFPEENRHLVRWISARRDQSGHARAPAGAHYLVARATEDESGLSPLRSVRLGPYQIYEYRPILDYDSWRCGTGDSDRASIGQWHSPALEDRHGVLSVAPGEPVVCRGIIRPRAGDVVPKLSIYVVAWAPVEATRLEAGGRVLTPMARLSRQEPLMLRAAAGWSMGLGWASETVFELTGALGPGEHTIAVALSGPGRVISVDVYEGRSW